MKQVYKYTKSSFLRDYFQNNKGRPISKWIQYFEIYEEHFQKYRGKPVNILEIGIDKGGSLQMWKAYFGKKARIFGLDINPAVKAYEESQIKILIGDQGDRAFLRRLRSELPQLDIVIDDGGHTMKQQIISFEELYPHVKEDGVYLCEDCQTSYTADYHGGYKKPGTFIEYSKDLIDSINAHSSHDSRLKVTPFTKSAYSIAFYDGVVVVRKNPRLSEGYYLRTGNIPASEKIKDRIWYQGVVRLKKKHLNK